MRTFLEQELGALEALGQRLARGLLDHARTREADQRARLGDVDVAEHREARRHTARGRVGHHRDVRQLGRRQLGERRARLRHLQQRVQALPACARRRWPRSTRAAGDAGCSTSTPRTNRSPTTEPIEPEMNRNSNAAATIGIPSACPPSRSARRARRSRAAPERRRARDNVCVSLNRSGSCGSRFGGELVAGLPDRETSRAARARRSAGDARTWDRREGCGAARRDTAARRSRST